MNTLMAFLKYTIAGTAISATFIIITMMVYLYTLHGGLDEEVLAGLLSGKWPDPPVEMPEAEPISTADSLDLEIFKLENWQTRLRTFQIGLDRREKRVEQEEKNLEAERKSLELLKQEIDVAIASKGEQESNRLIQISKLMESMKPAESAPIIQNMSDDVIVGVLLHMKEQQAAKILANLEPDRAATITQQISKPGN